MRLGLLSLAVTAVISLPLAASAATELVTNGDFESDLSGWTCSGFTATFECRSDGEVSGVGPGEGSFSFFGFQNSGVGILSQTVSTDTGALYDFSFIHALTLSETGNTLSYRIGGGPATMVTGAEVGVYNDANDQFTATGESTLLEFLIETETGQGGWRLDSVSIQAADSAVIPVPAALPLMGGALAGLFAVARRRA